jgi:hypothetical protein
LLQPHQVWGHVSFFVFGLLSLMGRLPTSDIRVSRCNASLDTVAVPLTCVIALTSSPSPQGEDARRCRPGGARDAYQGQWSVQSLAPHV